MAYDEKSLYKTDSNIIIKYYVRLKSSIMYSSIYIHSYRHTRIYEYLYTFKFKIQRTSALAAPTAD